MPKSDIAIIIPSRLNSKRLPQKALSMIGDHTMIEHIILRLSPKLKNNLYVATDSKKIAKKVEEAGAIAIMTSERCPTGSDRVYEALHNIPNYNQIKYVLNIQGDMPFVNYEIIEQIIYKLKNSNFDIVTPVVKVGKDIACNNSNIKVVTDTNGRALYFSRAEIPYDSEEFLYHVGIYGYRVEALEKFVNFSKTPYEFVEKLEQLRAIENGMSIGVVISKEIPISVDTYQDLDKARNYYKNKKKE